MSKPVTIIRKKEDVKEERIEMPIMKEEELNLWMNDLYDISKITPEMVKDMWEYFSYKGFNRDDVLKQLYTQVKDKKTIYELIVVGALRGPQAAAKMKLSSGLTPIEMQIVGSGQKGNKRLSMNKIVSATADIAAWFLKQMGAPKRLAMELPGWLQFPSAGSIIMPPNVRSQHLEFSKRFSTVIGGEFNEGIYMQMESNAYMDPRLKLFG